MKVAGPQKAKASWQTPHPLLRPPLMFAGASQAGLPEHFAKVFSRAKVAEGCSNMVEDLE